MDDMQQLASRRVREEQQNWNDVDRVLLAKVSCFSSSLTLSLFHLPTITYSLHASMTSFIFSLTHSLTHSLTRSLTSLFIDSFTHSVNHSQSVIVGWVCECLAGSVWASEQDCNESFILPLTHSLIHSAIHSVSGFVSLSFMHFSFTTYSLNPDSEEGVHPPSTSECRVGGTNWISLSRVVHSFAESGIRSFSRPTR